MMLQTFEKWKEDLAQSRPTIHEPYPSNIQPATIEQMVKEHVLKESDRNREELANYAHQINNQHRKHYDEKLASTCSELTIAHCKLVTRMEMAEEKIKTCEHTTEKLCSSKEQWSSSVDLKLSKLSADVSTHLQSESTERPNQMVETQDAISTLRATSTSAFQDQSERALRLEKLITDFIHWSTSQAYTPALLLPP